MRKEQRDWEGETHDVEPDLDPDDDDDDEDEDELPEFEPDDELELPEFEPEDDELEEELPDELPRPPLEPPPPRRFSRSKKSRMASRPELMSTSRMARLVVGSAVAGEGVYVAASRRRRGETDNFIVKMCDESEGLRWRRDG